MFVDGAWTGSLSGETFTAESPATGETIATVPKGGRQDAQLAIGAANRAAGSWSHATAFERAAALHRVADEIERRTEELARTLTLDQGKPLREAQDEVEELLLYWRNAAEDGKRLEGRLPNSISPGKRVLLVRRPRGVIGVITPWNWPYTMPAELIAPALACGNTVVWTPASTTAVAGIALAECVVEADLPPGVFNLVTGPGSTVGDEIARNPGTHGVGFVGSTETGRLVAEAAVGKAAVLELGGNGPVVVMDDADLDLALEGVLWGAFGTTGQRCTATSRLVLHRKIHDRFLRRLADRVEKLRLGDGLLPATDVGPMINEAALRNTMRYVAIATDEGDELVTGGKRARRGKLAHGWFHQPTVFAGVKPKSRLEQEEVFGPVLAVIRVGSLDEAIRVNNDVRYGLSSALYTNDLRSAYQAIEDLDAGITYVNAPTIGAEAHLPFGGVKETGNGHREGGWQVYDFFSETKVAYIDCSGVLQRAQIDTYDV